MDTATAKRSWLIPALGLTQIVGWGSMFYAYGVLMQPMETELHTTRSVVVGAYSIALLISGCLSTLAGAIIDRIGGRLLMGVGTLLAAAMLALLANVQSVLGLYLVWAGIGVAMSATLYQSSFAVLTQVFGTGYRRAITALTLFGGFASTVFWPLTQALSDHFGWRETWLIYAVLNLLMCFPIHALLPKHIATADISSRVQKGKASLAAVLRERSFYLLTAAVTFNALVFSAMSLHLMSILQSRGISPSYAAAIGAMVGPMQVLGRILETTVGRKMSSYKVGVLAMWLLPLALVLLFAPNQWLAIYAVFAAMYGISNGVMTIVRGTLPAELYGREAYGAVSGAMGAPVMVAIAAGPFAASLLYAFTDGYVGTLLVLIAVGVLGSVLFACTSTSMNKN
ncbi:MFS transporter [Herminiimonas arsenitoxidans]|uniref:MFS transporter n=1 Tax=Herminiimonas arsenitoxidans TaxID=1809410 RepID=UPI000970E82B|nr:MFS transporter [Herminiimonas arsenitoxidans]